MNSLFQQLNQTTAIPNNIKQLVNSFKFMSNPQAMANQMLNSNPQLQNVIRMAGGNPEQAFKTMCKQYNVNPDEIMNMLR